MKIDSCLRRNGAKIINENVMACLFLKKKQNYSFITQSRKVAKLQSCKDCFAKTIGILICYCFKKSQPLANNKPTVYCNCTLLLNTAHCDCLLRLRLIQFINLLKYLNKSPLVITAPCSIILNLSRFLSVV